MNINFNSIFGGLALSLLIFIIGMACSGNFNSFMMELITTEAVVEEVK